MGTRTGSAATRDIATIILLVYFLYVHTVLEEDELKYWGF